MKKLVITLLTVIMLNSCTAVALIGVGAAAGAITYDCVSENGRCNKKINEKKNEEKYNNYYKERNEETR